ncbi:MAG: penicillin-binding protein 2 [Alphaproteobacteria bacterium]
MTHVRLPDPRPDRIPHCGAAARDRGHVRQAIETGRTRLVLSGALFAMGFLVIGLRLVDVTMFRQGAEPALSSAPQADQLRMERADIVDRNGVILATSLETASLYAHPKQVIDAAEAAKELAAVLPDLDQQETAARLASNRAFVWIRRNLTPKQEYAVNRLGVPGLYFQREDRRVYPYGALASHAVGFADIDNKGLAGAENEFDAKLREGTRPLQLSLDIRVQNIVHEELAGAMREFDAAGAAGVVLDVRTGEVLAMVSLPDFDPNEPAAFDSEARFNRATLGIYEMGSTFKIFTTAMALESGVATIEDGYDASDPIRVARFTIRDYKPKGRWLSIPEIFVYSSNIGAAKMALDVGAARQRAFLGRLGLLQPATIELPEVGSPMVPSPWREINTMTVGYGHGLAVSPVQMAAAVAPMVNGGVLHPATLLKAAASGAQGARVLSEKTSDEIRRLMRLNVVEGTGTHAAVPGYLVGGKTGTAEKNADGNYNRKSLLSSFVASFPMNEPRYVVLVMLDEPKGNAETHGYATGGWVAAPAAGAVIARMASLVGIEPVDEEAPEIREALNLDLSSRGRRLASY